MLMIASRFALASLPGEAEVLILQSVDAAQSRPDIDPGSWDELSEIIPADFIPCDPTGLSGKHTYNLDVVSFVRFTTVFSLQICPRLVLVYRQHCPEQGAIDPSVRDFWFLLHVRETHVSPRVYHISNPLDGATVASVPNGKMDIHTCANGEYPHIRYTMMDLVSGRAVDELMLWNNKRFTIHESVTMGANILRALQKLHAMDVLHGDLHWGNIMVAGHEIQLIDYERASIYDSEQMDALKKFPCGVPMSVTLSIPELLWVGSFNTLWESHFCPKSFRDDLYRALVVIATMIHGPAYDMYFRELSQEGPTKWLILKASGQVFNVQGEPGEGKPAKFLISDHVSSEDTADLENARFMQLARYASKLGMHDRPEYDVLIGLLEDIAHSTGDAS